jgi:hypothetical protein
MNRKLPVWVLIAAIGLLGLLALVRTSYAHEPKSLAVAPAQDAQGAVGAGGMIMDGDWFYIVHGHKLYKVQKSTMSVFQSIDLN